MRPLIIGIAGGTGSGKTTLVENLKEQFGADISVLPHDNYYAAHHDMSLEERQALNYDHPAAFDTDRMIQDLEDLKAGKTVQCPIYDYAIHDRTLESVMEQYLTTVKPMHEQFVEPSKRYADVIVPEGGKNLVALMMIVQRIAYHIEHGDVVDEQ